MLKVNDGVEPPIVCTILMYLSALSLLITKVCIEAEPVTWVKVAPDKSVYVPLLASEFVSLISKVGLEPVPAALSRTNKISPSNSSKSIAELVAVDVFAPVATPEVTVVCLSSVG